MKARRGNVLLVTVISLAVLMVLVAGAIRFTGTNREAAAIKLRGDRTNSCVEIARRYLLSRLKVYGLNPADQQFDVKLMDELTEAERSRIKTAHLGQTNLEPVGIASSASFGASRRSVRDSSNVIAPGTLGGQFYRVAVKCEEANGRETELEFVFRYGL